MKINYAPMRKAVHILAILFLLSICACNSQKRTTKALMKMNSKEMNSIRPWPHNYSYQEYVDQLNEVKLRKEFYTERKMQASVAGDNKTAQIMGNNIIQAEKKIKRLEKDKKFHKIYKIQSRAAKKKNKKEPKEKYSDTIE